MNGNRVMNTLGQVVDFLLKASGMYITTVEGQREYQDILQAVGYAAPDENEAQRAQTDDEFLSQAFAQSPDVEAVYNQPVGKKQARTVRAGRNG